MMDRSSRRAERYRARVLDELATLDAVTGSAVDDARPVELDQQSVGRLSRIDAMQRQAMALEMQRRRVERRLRLQQTLKRMEGDEFGYCTECGEPIPDGRLEIDPTFHHCVNCAQLS